MGLDLLKDIFVVNTLVVVCWPWIWLLWIQGCWKQGGKGGKGGNCLLPFAKISQKLLQNRGFSLKFLYFAPLLLILPPPLVGKFKHPWYILEYILAFVDSINHQIHLMAKILFIDFFWKLFYSTSLKANIAFFCHLWL